MNKTKAGVLFIALHTCALAAQASGAETVAVKEKPPLFRCVSYWAFPRANWAEVERDDATTNQKILAAALANGSISGYGDEENQVHSAEGFTHDTWFQAKSIAGFMKLLKAVHKAGGSSSTRHWDQIYVSHYYNWKAGSWKGAYQYSGTYKLKSDAPDADDAVRALSSFYVPVFEKMLADGIIVEYEIAREMIHTTDSRAQLHFSFLMPSAESLDKFQAALGNALDNNSLIGPAFGSMMVNFSPQTDWVQVNATYK